MTGSAPPPGWITRQRATANRRRPRCVTCGHRRVIDTEQGPHCRQHADELPLPITFTRPGTTKGERP